MTIYRKRPFAVKYLKLFEEQDDVPFKVDTYYIAPKDFEGIDKTTSNRISVKAGDLLRISSSGTMFVTFYVEDGTSDLGRHRNVPNGTMEEWLTVDGKMATKLSKEDVRGKFNAKKFGI